jgi:5-methyltetrahydrofolate--homocysteine methyltransferase
MSSQFVDALRTGHVLLMDGAMGTELHKAGLLLGERGELWNRIHPDRVLAVHSAYVAAGADIILTNTFLANPEQLALHNLHESLGELNQLAIELAQHAAGPYCHVLGDVGPFGVLGEGIREMCSPFLNVAGLMMETWSDAVSADRFLNSLHAHQRFDDLPVLLSISYNRDWLLDPAKASIGPERWADWTNAHPRVVALGVNCGREIGVAECAEIVRRYRSATDLPIFARPNAGTPVRVDDRWVYPRSPAQMAAELPCLLEAGVSLIGGCCGTTPAHIAAFRSVINQWNDRAATKV